MGFTKIEGRIIERSECNPPNAAGCAIAAGQAGGNR